VSIVKEKNNKYYSIEGKFLIASPNMSDQRFFKSLIYMISDTVHGSMGIIINKPALDIKIENIFEELQSQNDLKHKIKCAIHFGGPVEFDKGFILHSNDYNSTEEKTLLKNNLVLSSNIKILKDLSLGNGPSKFLVAIGYAGWYGNQLSEELKNNSWFVTNANKKILFSKNHKKKWHHALKSIGLEDSKLESFKYSNYSGSA